MSAEDTIKLGEACDILNGFAFKSSRYVEEGIRIIRIANVQKGFIEDSSPCFYPFEAEDEVSQFALQEGDLLMSLTGNVGRVGLLGADLLPAALNQRVACLRLKTAEILDKGYLFHLLNSDAFEKKCIDASNGVAQKNLSTRWLSSFEVPIVPMSEQVHRSTVLDCVAACLSKLKDEIDILDSLIKSRFVEMFGNGQGQWETIPLGDICTVVRGGSPRPIDNYLGGDIPWIKIGDASKNDSIYLRSTKEFITRDGIKKSRLLKPGSLIFANSGSLGFARIITFEGCIHDGWLALQDVDERLDKVFLLLSLNQMTDEFRLKAPEGTQPNLNTDIVKKHPQIVPPIDAQKEYVAFVNQVDKSKVVVQESIEKLELLKASLMQEYFG